jgi:hypothetical protein
MTATYGVADDVSVGDELDGVSAEVSDGDGLPEIVVREVGLGAFDFVGVLLGVGERLVWVGCGVLVSSGVTV